MKNFKEKTNEILGKATDLFTHEGEMKWLDDFIQPKEVPKYEFNMIRKALENDPMPGNKVYIGKRPKN